MDNECTSCAQGRFHLGTPKAHFLVNPISRFPPELNLHKRIKLQGRVSDQTWLCIGPFSTRKNSLSLQRRLWKIDLDKSCWNVEYQPKRKKDCLVLQNCQNCGCASISSKGNQKGDGMGMGRQIHRQEERWFEEKRVANLRGLAQRILQDNSPSDGKILHSNRDELQRCFPVWYELWRYRLERRRWKDQNDTQVSGDGEDLTPDQLQRDNSCLWVWGLTSNLSPRCDSRCDQQFASAATGFKMCKELCSKFWCEWKREIRAQSLKSPGHTITWNHRLSWCSCQHIVKILVRFPHGCMRVRGICSLGNSDIHPFGQCQASFWLKIAKIGSKLVKNSIHWWTLLA